MTRGQDNSKSAARDRLAGLAFDPRALAAHRIGLAVMVLVQVARFLLEMDTFYTDTGAVPRSLALAESDPPLQFRLFFLSGTPLGTTLLALPTLLAAVALAAGRFTRIASVICWLGVSAMMARNPFVLNFGDRILRLLLFWSCFLPLAEVWVAGTRKSERAAAPTGVLGIGTLGYIAQILAIYFVGALHKNDPAWWDGNAVQMALQIDLLTTPIGAAMSGWPALLQVFTWGTLLLEGVVVWLVISPWRTAACRFVAVAAFVGFHLGLGLAMRLGPFPLICMVAWVPFLPAAFWDRLGARPGVGPPRVKLIGGPSSWIALAALLLVVAINVQSLRLRSGPLLPGPFEAVALGLGLDQRWTMFAPHPTRADGWLVAVGHLADGRLVDALGQEAGVTYAKPEDPGAGRSARWLSYTVKLYAGRDESRQKQALASHLCGRWNRGHPDPEWIDFVAIDFVQERTLPAGQEDEPIRVPLVRWPCDRVFDPGEPDHAR